MKFAKAFGWFPVPVFRSVPAGGFKGYTRILTLMVIPLAWIKLHPDYWDDEHLLEHELQHVEDYFRHPWFYWLRYKTPEGRLHYEARAYARQYASYGEKNFVRFNQFVDLICERYGLNFDRSFVFFILEKEVEKYISMMPNSK